MVVTECRRVDCALVVAETCQHVAAVPAATNYSTQIDWQDGCYNYTQFLQSPAHTSYLQVNGVFKVLQNSSKDESN